MDVIELYTLSLTEHVFMAVDKCYDQANALLSNPITRSDIIRSMWKIPMH